MARMLKRYLAGVDRAVDLTPPERNRVVDAWRVVALFVVVFGHWLAASVWVEPDGTVRVLNTLEWIPYAGWVTWVVQVMPIFFFVGGYANARALTSHDRNRRTWITVRFRRLYAPAVPVILVWTVLAVVLRNFVSEDLVYAGVLNATIPLWFLAVYLLLVAIAPLTHVWWQRSGMWSFVSLACASVVVDILYRGFDVPGVGWLNLIFTWGAVHQLGYWWADREATGDVLTPARAAAFGFASLAALVVATSVSWYPVAMITIPGAGPQNVTPPTTAVMLLGMTQAGLILATRGSVRRFVERRRAWRLVVAVSGFIMTIYVWHLTSLSLTIAAGIFTFDGRAFSPEPGTSIWWITRPVFFAVLAAVTAVFVVVFGIFERDVDTDVRHHSMLIVVFGLAATVTALGATAFVYLVDRDIAIAWWIPVTAVVAALVVGAYPASWRRRSSPLQ